MNIFYLDQDIGACARAHMDDHVVKMTLETAQVLCTALHLNDEGNTLDDIPYRPTHCSHPCVTWAAESRSNVDWLLDFGLALCEEYTYRYDKTHACERKVIDWMIETSPQRIVPDRGMTERPLATDERYKIHDDPVTCYRHYYVHEKRNLASWTGREVPTWWRDMNIS